MISVSQALLATVLFALVIFATRLFPFALFSRRDPPKLLRFIEQSIPPAVMAILVVYSLKDIPWAETGGLPHIAALTLAVLLHARKKNALLSIFGSTALFMVLRSLL
ncbi:MAG TPA: AzlD domain-containing protein [Treponemataceae bacterium]|nr:AzlD domain-containing protein [Treponemataceae bacterium]